MLFNSHYIHQSVSLFLLAMFSLVLLDKFLRILSTALLQSAYLCISAAGVWKCKESISMAYLWTLGLFPPPSVIYSFSLSLLFPRGFPNHTTTPLTDAALTDLQPSSFHWPPAWQLRFKAAFSLAKSWQVNLWVYCDLMPPAFEVSYSSVAYRTQKRCQVANRKILSLKGGGAGV